MVRLRAFFARLSAGVLARCGVLFLRAGNRCFDVRDSVAPDPASTLTPEAADRILHGVQMRLPSSFTPTTLDVAAANISERFGATVWYHRPRAGHA